MASGEGKQVFRPEGGEEKRELWDSRLILLLAAVGYVDGFGMSGAAVRGQKGGGG